MVISDLSYLEGMEQESFILGGSQASQPYPYSMTCIAMGTAEARAMASSPYSSTFTYASLYTRAGILPGGGFGSFSCASSISVVA
jgi:hypothetical protein